jgi:peptidoglycan/LPS O-acetylase OafA/YrhL
MTSYYLHAPSRGRRHPRWRRWALLFIGLAALFLAPAFAHSAEHGGVARAAAGSNRPAAGCADAGAPSAGSRTR